ncbi:MAG: TonB-dependent receptor [Chitinophagales bacterium]|nr:MAG: TonB-dependent receptor [Chitinophagales bacterium]
MSIMKICSLITLILVSVLPCTAQKAVVFGYITDENGDVVAGVNVYPLLDPTSGTISDHNGRFELQLDAPGETRIVFSFIGYESDTLSVNLQPGQHQELSIILHPSIINISLIEITDKEALRNEASGIYIESKDIEKIPTPFAGIEAALAAQALGVSSTNELSSTYSVRGGNFDENLVYVNDFEVFRPFLIRSGEQEGLSFIHSNLVSSVFFSSGGFQPKYGDKMSSVLDVRYKKPNSFRGSVELGLLGGSAHVEAASKNERFTFLLGIRQKSSQYLLKSLETAGQYSPSFTDLQTFITYRLNNKLDLELIGNFAMNRFVFKPVSRETTFGVVNRVLRLTVYFDGKEEDRYRTLMGGFALNHHLQKNIGLKWLISAYRSVESEAFDIIGEYWLDEVESDFGKENFGQTRYSLGVGGLQQYTRNNLEATMIEGAHKGYCLLGKHHFKWGVNYRHERIEDRINEWERVDSAGYSIPYTEEQITLSAVLKSDIRLNSNRISGYVQDTWSLNNTARTTFTYGIRFTYWDVNNEFVASPRIQFAFRPKTKKADLSFRMSAGLYNQPPFYRELRDLNGNVHKDVRAQKSFHTVAGIDLNFKAWDRKFKFITEVYYKYLWDLVPYQFDNVLIRYFGENQARGYAAGIDFRLHGELVEDAESWISVSIMSTQEDIKNDSYSIYLDSLGNRVFLSSANTDAITDTLTVYPGFIPRPTDRRFKLNLFFQDYIPRVKFLKVHLNLVFATGLPFGPPTGQRYQDVLRIPFYRRVDIGFSAQLFDRNRKELPPKNFMRHFESIWATLEVYNLIGVNNTVSYLWIKDISNTIYAVPNHLTNRRINFRIIFKF